MTYSYEDKLGEYARKLERKLDDGRLTEDKYTRLYGKLVEWMRYNKAASEWT